MGDFWGVFHPWEDAYGSATTAHSISTFAIQYWVTPIVWLKGGGGIGNMRLIDESAGGVTFRQESGFAIMGSGGVEIVQAANFALDLQLPDSSGIATLTRFLQHCGRAPVIILSGLEDPGLIRDTLAAGARGYVPKSSSRDVLIAALRLVAEGGIYIPPQVLSVMTEQPMRAELAASDGPPASSPLTERQIEVLSLASRGLGNRLIARQLGIA